jgi:hypothetical protein
MSVLILSRMFKSNLLSGPSVFFAGSHFMNLISLRDTDSGFSLLSFGRFSASSSCHTIHQAHPRFPLVLTVSAHIWVMIWELCAVPPGFLDRYLE